MKHCKSLKPVRTRVWQFLQDDHPSSIFVDQHASPITLPTPCCCHPTIATRHANSVFLFFKDLDLVNHGGYFVYFIKINLFLSSLLRYTKQGNTKSQSRTHSNPNLIPFQSNFIPHSKHACCH